VSLPETYPGLVIRDAYLWRREYEAGREEGTKDRPYSIFMSVINDGNESVVLVGSALHSQVRLRTPHTRWRFWCKPRAAWALMPTTGHGL
jgi:hypothetical protein